MTELPDIMLAKAYASLRATTAIAHSVPGFAYPKSMVEITEQVRNLDKEGKTWEAVRLANQGMLHFHRELEKHLGVSR